EDVGEKVASIDPRDVADDVVEEIIELGFNHAEEYQRIKHFLPDLIARLVDAWFAVRRVRSLPVDFSIDERTPLDPGPTGPYDRWDEVMEFWTPDEVLRQEDVMEDERAVNPERAAEEREN